MVWYVRWVDQEGNLQELRFDSLDDAETEAAALREKSEFVEISDR